MIRKYKEDTPENTILRINNILNNIGIVTYESYFGSAHKNIYSCRTSILDSFGQFGQNGKGLTPEYALASSHAEFMERLQNGFLFGMPFLSIPFIHKIKSEEGFVFFPDEKIMTFEDFIKLPIEYLKDIFGDISLNEIKKEAKFYFNAAKRNGVDGIISLPFFDYKTKEKIYLPYNISLMITGSNGMSAGNTMSEGLFQALCEILERVAAATIYHQNLTPPTVPDNVIIKNTILFRIIKDIEAAGYQVIIKDFSVNHKLPVLGTIIINKKKNKYRLNVGADTNFDVALSRTLTEIHQGLTNKSELESVMIDIPQNKVIKTSYESFKIDENLENFFQDGRGQFPSSLFGNKESYSFDESAFCDSKDYKDGCKYLLKLIESLGSRIFIRDTSFLGFPSYYVYATHISSFRNNGISKHISKSLDVLSNVEYGKIEKKLLN